MAVKRLFFLVLCLDLLINSHVIGQQISEKTVTENNILFSEEFENNNNEWIINNNWIKGKLQDGNYTVTSRNYRNQTGLTFKPVPYDLNKDVEIETSFRIKKGIAAFIFGVSEDFDHYRVELTDKKNSLDILRDNTKTKKVEKLFSGSLKSTVSYDNPVNILIRKTGKNYTFFINEEQAFQTSQIDPQGNQLGFGVGLNSEITADFIKVKYIDNNTGSAVAIRSTQSESKNLDIKWISPSGERTKLDSYQGRIRAGIRSESGIKSILVYINGISKGEPEIRTEPGEPGLFTVEKMLSFGPGENSVYIIVSNNEGQARSDIRYFTNPEATVPVVTWQNPETSPVVANSASIDVEACIKSSTDLKSVRIMVNGISLTEDNVFQPSGIDECNYLWKNPVILKEGDNSVFIIAANAAGSKTSEELIIKYQPALEEKRIALVIGNSNYGSKSSLKNPLNDANLMASTLQIMGFDVIKRIDADKKTMESAIREFTEKLPQYNVALFYYAGHGNQVDGTNYIIPTDAMLTTPEACQFEAIKVDFIVSQFERYPKNTNIVILDACRDNPYAAWERGSLNGFKAMSFSNGTIISFATSEGATAADGKGANGLFTEELVRQMYSPQTIENVFKKTRIEVSKKSNGRQVPQEWTKLVGDFYFVKENK